MTPDVAKKLVAVRASLAATIEEMSPHTKTVAVLDYYQPIPQPAQIVDGSVHSHAGTNLVCTALKSNAGVTAAAAQVVLVRTEPRHRRGGDRRRGASRRQRPADRRESEP